VDGDPQKLKLRLPKGLYDDLAEQAEANETSMKYLPGDHSRRVG
jgi:hypothetical protein